MTTAQESIKKFRKKYLKRGKKLAAQLAESGVSKDDIICAGDWLLEQMTLEELKGEQVSAVAGRSKGKSSANAGKNKQAKQR